MTLTKSVVRATSWSAFSQAGRQISQFAVTVVLARLLSPDDFGVVAIATVVTGFVMLFSDLGTATAVIQKKDHTPAFLSSVFWVNAAFGVVVMLFVVAVSPLISWLYGEPRLTGVLIALSFSFPVAGVVAMQRALLEKAMRFDLLARIEMLSTAIGGAIGIAAALAGGGAWALVVQTVTSVLAMAVLLWAYSDWRPRLQARLAEIRSIAGFSGYLTGFNVVNYFARNADYMLIGWFLGSEDLGYYTMAYRILLFPLQNLTAVINRVALPAFSRIQEDEARFRRAYLTSIGGISSVSFPLMAGIFTIPRPFVETLLGERWLPMLPILMILAPVGLVQSIVATAGSVYIARNQTAALFRWGLLSSLVVIAAFIIGLSWGVVGVAACYAIASLALAYPAMAIPLRLIGLKVKDSAAVLWAPFVSALSMALVVFILTEAASAVLPPWQLLVVDAAAGTAAYLLLSLLINGEQLRMFKNLLSSQE